MAENTRLFADIERTSHQRVVKVNHEYICCGILCFICGNGLRMKSDLSRPLTSLLGRLDID